MQYPFEIQLYNSKEYSVSFNIDVGYNKEPSSDELLEIQSNKFKEKRQLLLESMYTMFVDIFGPSFRLYALFYVSSDGFNQNTNRVSPIICNDEGLNLTGGNLTFRFDDFMTIPEFANKLKILQDDIHVNVCDDEPHMRFLFMKTGAAYKTKNMEEYILVCKDGVIECMCV